MLALAAGAGDLGGGNLRHIGSAVRAGKKVNGAYLRYSAAPVLLGVGIWMHQKSVGGRWQAILRAKLSAALDRPIDDFLYSGLSFIAVVREVFETNLVLSALWTEGQKPAIGAGLFAGPLRGG